MNTLIIIALLLSFFVLVFFAFRGANLVLAFFLISIVWAVLGGATLESFQKDMINAAVISAGPTIFAVMFGSWFGRVLIETGIINAIIKKTVELGGDHCLLTTSLLSIVTALIFTGAYGVGIVMAIGMITLPIMFSLGVPKPVAVTAFCFAVTAGNYVNPAVFTMMLAYYPDLEYNGPFMTFAPIGMCVHLAVCLIMLLFRLRKGKLQHQAAWAVEAPVKERPPVEGGKKRLFFLAYFAPIFPVLIVVTLNWEIIPAMVISIIITLILAGEMKNPKKCLEMALRTFRDGTADVALLILLFFSIWVYARAAANCAPLLQPLFEPLIPKNPWVLAIAFGILTPLGLFRGPLTYSGVGAVTQTILSTFGYFQPIFRMLMIFMPWMCMTYTTCPTMSNVAWTLTYAKTDPKSHIFSTLPWAWAACIINLLIAAFMFG